jgi:hypothetical protein
MKLKEIDMQHEIKLFTEVKVDAESLKYEPLLLAEAFAEMNSDNQAEFFTHLAELAKTWNKPDGFYYQMLSVVRDFAAFLSDEGVNLMVSIGKAGSMTIRA